MPKRFLPEPLFGNPPVRNAINRVPGVHGLMNVQGGVAGVGYTDAIHENNVTQPLLCAIDEQSAANAQNTDDGFEHKNFTVCIYARKFLQIINI